MHVTGAVVWVGCRRWTRVHCAGVVAVLGLGMRGWCMQCLDSAQLVWLAASAHVFVQPPRPVEQSCRSAQWKC